MVLLDHSGCAKLRNNRCLCDSVFVEIHGCIPHLRCGVDGDKHAPAPKIGGIHPVVVVHVAAASVAIAVVAGQLSISSGGDPDVVGQTTVYQA